MENKSEVASTIILSHQVKSIKEYQHSDETIDKTTAFLNHLAGAKWTTKQINQEAKLRVVQQKLQNFVLRLGWCTKTSIGVWLF